MTKQISKTIKVELILVKLNLQTLFAYRLNTLLIFLGSGFYNIGMVLFITFIFTKIPLLTGWDKWDLMLMYGIGQIFAYLYFFSTYLNIAHFHKKIDTGFFDFFLTKPVNSLIYSTLHHFSFESLIGMVQAWTIIAYALGNKSFQINIIGIIIAILSLAITLGIVHSLNVLTVIPNFWSIRSRFDRFFGNTANLANYPYEIFDNKITKFIFFIILPYALLINIPFRAIIGKLDYRLFFLQIAVCIGFIFITNKLWKLGVKNYASASS